MRQGSGTNSAEKSVIGTRHPPAWVPRQGVYCVKKKMIFLTLGAALIAAPVFAAPGGRTGDADGNGVLTRAEAQAHATDRFAKMDTNKDGKIDAADRQAARAAMQAKRFAAFDANSDGSISKAEWDQHGADRQAKQIGRAHV